MPDTYTKEDIARAFNSFIPLTSPMLKHLEEVFTPKSFTPRQFITEAGNIERYFFIVLSGVQAVYLIDQKGDKHVLGFTYSGNVSGVYDSFIYQRPSDYFLESITHSELLAIRKSDFDELFIKFPEFLKWRVAFIEQIFMGRGQREVELLTLSAHERFDLFMKRCPSELLTIPQKYLASYLNMKPETFSRLRARKN